MTAAEIISTEQTSDREKVKEVARIKNDQPESQSEAAEYNKASAGWRYFYHPWFNTGQWALASTNHN
ncbi:hypothetical protein C9I99_15025 [Photobacterium lutimaris]|uniref:Uncharacterized protein n=1 Tax=Photobacterium lutimaris TaxID=388278 RepID=A0A2T3IWP9_9GAMM|nr:hypothetical protein C9I99_15025 [Photobacterium lutimaris]